MFPIQSNINFLFDPEALDGIFGEDKQQFVKLVDGLIDFRAEFIARCTILIRQPAGNAVGFEIGREFGDEWLVVGGVTDDAGVVMG